MPIKVPSERRNSCRSFEARCKMQSTNEMQTLQDKYHMHGIEHVDAF